MINIQKTGLIFMVLSVLFLNIEFLFSQWLPDVRLTNNGSISQTTFNHGKCISASGDTLHVVFYDARSASFQVYYKRSTNSGTTWENETRLSLNTNGGAFPSVASSGLYVYAAWWDIRNGSNDEIYFKSSTDGGLTWGTDTRISNDPAGSYYPAVGVFGANVHIAWLDNRHGAFEIYYIRSSDNGATWGPETRITNNNSSSEDPSLSVSGQVLHLAYNDDLNSTDYEIYYKRSTDNGSTWSNETRISDNDSVKSVNTCVSSFGNNVSIVWEDRKDGNQEIYYSGSSDAGVTWSSPVRLTSNDSISQYPTVVLSGQIIHLAWWDKREGNNEIYYKRSVNNGQSWEADFRLTNDPASSEYPSITVSGTGVHLVWQDLRAGGFNSEIFYKKNPNGNPLGLHSTNSELPDKFNLSQNYPNPFNPVTNIRFSLSKASFVILKVFDILGNEIDVLVKQNLNAGNFSIDWNAEASPSGVYFYSLKAGEFFETRKMILIK